jgi:hypothetical protein
MKWTGFLLGSLTAATLVACGGERRANREAPGSESGTMQGGTSADTGMSAADTAGRAGMTGGMSTDTTTGRMHTDHTATDSGKSNQTKSGVTNTKSGKSTLGKGVTRTRPDQGQPVTSKGDTVSQGPDTSASNR